MGVEGKEKNAVLFLEDGVFFEGKAFGAEGESFGEVVFNTSLTGYQEVLTDPSYRGQIVAMTYPLIGNYGIVPEDDESRGPWLSGFVIREASAIRSNWRSAIDLRSWLAGHRIVGIQGIDTRALTRHLRINGSKHGVISTMDFDSKSLAEKLAGAPRIVGKDLVKEVSCEDSYEWKESAEYRGGSLPPSEIAPPTCHHVVVIDCGVKRNILRHLVSMGCRVTVVPAAATAKEILRLSPDGLLLSNGPGDPEPVTYVIDTVKELLGRLPIFGICLGHQMLGLAMGGRTYKLKFGHHGGNHPVRNISTGAIAITTQNHGFNVDMDSIPLRGTRTTHVNLYDGTSEGMENDDVGIFSVQYHPEAAPGPHDAERLFHRFSGMMGQRAEYRRGNSRRRG